MSDRKAYNPRSFCRSYVMDNEPLNTCDQKDMTEFFNDLIAKLEDMTPELRDLVHNLFRGEITNSKLLSRCVGKIFIHLIQLLALLWKQKSSQRTRKVSGVLLYKLIPMKCGQKLGSFELFLMTFAKNPEA